MLGITVLTMLNTPSGQLCVQFNRTAVCVTQEFKLLGGNTTHPFLINLHLLLSPVRCQVKHSVQIICIILPDETFLVGDVDNIFLILCETVHG